MAGYRAYIATRHVKHIAVHVRTEDGRAGYRAICGSSSRHQWRPRRSLPRLLWSLSADDQADPLWRKPVCRHCLAEAETVAVAAGLPETIWKSFRWDDA